MIKTDRIIIIGALIIAIGVGIYNNKDKSVPYELRQQFETNGGVDLPKPQNWVVQGNKIVPLTVLSEADAKRPCTDCHDK